MYGHIIDAHSKRVLMGDMYVEDLAGFAENLATNHNKTVEIELKCRVCGKYFCPLTGYKKEFCSEDCYN